MYVAPEVLSNGLKYHGIRSVTPDDYLYCSLIVRAGSLRDKVQGSAHFLEHLLLSFVNEYGYNTSKASPISGKTAFDRTCFYFACKKTIVSNTINLIKAVFSGMCLKDAYFELVRQDVLSEYYSSYETLNRERILLSHVSERFCYSLPIGTKSSIESLKFDVVREFFSKEYSIDNMLLCIIGDADTRLIDELINKPIDSTFRKQDFNQNHQSTRALDVQKKNNELLIPISYPPFTRLNELYDNISIALLTCILKEYPSCGLIYIGIKEYSERLRFVSIEIDSDDSIDDFLLYIKKNLLICLEGKSEISDIRGEIKKRVSFQMNSPQLLSRVEDFFVYDTEFYSISNLVGETQYINSCSIADVAINLLSIKPILVENEQNTVREIDDWSIKKHEKN